VQCLFSCNACTWHVVICATIADLCTRIMLLPETFSNSWETELTQKQAKVKSCSVGLNERTFYLYCE